MRKRRQIVFGLVLALMALLGGQIVFGTPVFGATAPTISISLSPLSPLDVTPGHFDSVHQTVSVTTNNYTGYTSTLTNPTNSTDLVYISDNTLVIPTITLLSGTAFGSRINSSGWRVQANRNQTYTLDITYTPAPNKSISATFSPVSSGSSSFYTDSTNITYIPDSLDNATISLSGDGLSGDSSKDLSNATVLEFSVTKP